MTIEKVTEWMWRQSPNSERRTDSYYYNNANGTIIVVRGNQAPEESAEILKAQEVWAAYKFRGRQKLQKHSQVMYDYLKDKKDSVTNENIYT